MWNVKSGAYFDCRSTWLEKILCVINWTPIQFSWFELIYVPKEWHTMKLKLPFKIKKKQLISYFSQNALLRTFSPIWFQWFIQRRMSVDQVDKLSLSRVTVYLLQIPHFICDKLADSCIAFMFLLDIDVAESLINYWSEIWSWKKMGALSSIMFSVTFFFFLSSSITLP